MVSPAIPKSPHASHEDGNRTYQPYEIDPELASSKIAADLVALHGRAGNVTKEFVIWYGMLQGLNHRPKTDSDPGNPTYLDLSLLLSVFTGVFNNTVNIEGALFEKEWQYLMKPKLMLAGIQGQPMFESEEKESILTKASNFIFGKPSKPAGGEKGNGN